MSLHQAICKIKIFSKRPWFYSEESHTPKKNPNKMQTKNWTLYTTWKYLVSLHVKQLEGEIREERKKEKRVFYLSMAHVFSSCYLEDLFLHCFVLQIGFLRVGAV